jgi:hypothetical protein
MAGHLAEVFAFDLAVRRRQTPEQSVLNGHDVQEGLVFRRHGVRASAFTVDHGTQAARAISFRARQRRSHTGAWGRCPVTPEDWLFKKIEEWREARAVLLGRLLRFDSPAGRDPLSYRAGSPAFTDYGIERARTQYPGRPTTSALALASFTFNACHPA